MLVQRLNFLLPFEVKELTADDISALYALQAAHHAHHEIYLDRQVTKNDILADLTALPPKTRREQKFYLGFYQGEQLLGIVDLIVNYPTPTYAWLGSIMVKQEFLHQKIATKIMQALTSALKREGFQELLTAIPVTHSGAQTFFDTLGFSEGDLTSIYNPVLKRDQGVRVRGIML